MYVCIYVRTYVCMYVRTYVRMYVCRYVCMYMCMFLYIHVYTPRSHVKAGGTGQQSNQELKELGSDLQVGYTPHKTMVVPPGLGTLACRMVCLGQTEIWYLLANPAGTDSTESWHGLCSDLAFSVSGGQR